MPIDELVSEIRREVDGRCITRELLLKHTSLRVGGPAAIYVYPAGITSLSTLLQLCRTREIEVLLIGYGTNLLVCDDGFNGCVIDLTTAFADVEVENNRIRTGSGVWLNDVVKLSADNGLAGLEKLAGIPGSVGGGMSMNCGAFGSYISDFLTELEVMESGGEIRTLMKPEVEFGYRRAPGLVDRIVLRADFQLEKEEPDLVNSRIDETIAERFKRNVMTLPSAGSVFRNPEGHFAAQLLEAVGAKGMKIGGAEVSSEHANVIVNKRACSAADIYGLISKLRELVYKQFDLELELELRTVGFDEF